MSIRRKGRGDAAGDYPAGVNALSGACHMRDDLLAEFTQVDAVERELAVGGGDIEEAALGRVCVHAEKKVGGGEVEEA